MSHFKSRFEKLNSYIKEEMSDDEKYNLSIHIEETHFIRVSNSKIRQDTHVNQADVKFHFLKNERSLQLHMTFEDLESDWKATIQKLRANILKLPVTKFHPKFSEMNEVQCHQISTSPYSYMGLLKIIENIPSEIQLSAISSNALIKIGQANSTNEQINWFETSTYYFDYTLIDSSHKSVKGTYSADVTDFAKLEKKVNKSLIDLHELTKPIVELKPLRYKVYLSPSAVNELISLLNWGGFSLKSFKEGQSALEKLIKKQVELSKKLSINEDFSSNIVPRFNSYGEITPEHISLIQNGQLENNLINSKSASQFGTLSNAANDYETARSISVSSGSLDSDSVLKTLKEGIYLPHLHYLNWSDRANARITGMTRNGALYIQDGEVKGPIKDMRFNVSLFEIWNEENLIGLTKQKELIPYISSYFKSSIGAFSLPGMIVDNFEMTL